MSAGHLVVVKVNRWEVIDEVLFSLKLNGYERYDPCVHMQESRIKLKFIEDGERVEEVIMIKTG